MRRHTTTLAAAALTTALLTGCGSTSSEPDPAACKAAMTQQYADALDTGTEGERPAACDGIDDATLQRLAGQVLTATDGPAAEQLERDAENAMREAAEDAAPSLPAECRAWIESELLDSSDSIDAATGQDACAGLTDAELDQAIDDVTNDLIEQDTP